ncbi:hypothetical protein MRX96_028127 [Rhipicephalus microplus]
MRPAGGQELRPRRRGPNQRCHVLPLLEPFEQAPVGIKLYNVPSEGQRVHAISLSLLVHLVGNACRRGSAMRKLDARSRRELSEPARPPHPVPRTLLRRSRPAKGAGTHTDLLAVSRFYTLAGFGIAATLPLTNRSG